MNIILTGYFDRNFGDDIMQLMVTEAFKDDMFFVNFPRREMLTHLEGKPNVCINKPLPKIDAFVNVIGSGFQFLSKRAVLEKLYWLLGEKRPPCEKVAVVDCSAEPGHGKIADYLAVRELRKYNFVSCRDNASYKWISSVNKKADIRMHNDIVFGLGSEHIFPVSGENCLGVVLVNRAYITDNFEYYRSLAVCCDNFIQSSGRKVLFFAFDTGVENDVSAAISVRSLMRHSDMTEIVANNSNPDYIMKNFARCEKVVTSRFHGAIAAMLAGIPVAAVCDSSKLRILAKRYGFGILERSAITPEALDELIDGCTAPVQIPPEDRADARMHITELAQFLQGR